jgi:hypothetical protein
MSQIVRQVGLDVCLETSDRHFQLLRACCERAYHRRPTTQRNEIELASDEAPQI